jgi:bifunctional DNA-binding transcriptional regulator/antitoxin component of YhaV-PrlF toxin-antitoxin module
MKSSEKYIAILSTKGQLILPKTLVLRRQWEAGTRLRVEDTPDGIVLKKERIFTETKPDEVFGSLAYVGRPKTLKEMDDGIVAKTKQRHARKR